MRDIKLYLVFIFLFLFTLFTRFYNLNWGSPYYFHPDERNIASSVTQLHFPDQMHPHFFAYGSFPIYIIYFSGMIQNIASSYIPTYQIPDTALVSFEQAIVISRIYSAVLSSLSVLLLFFVGKKLWDKKMGIFLAAISSASVGFIQFSHFGTFEMWITFFTLLLFITLVTDKDNIKQTIFLSSLIVGILISTKVSNIVLAPIPIFWLVHHLFFKTTHISLKRKVSLLLLLSLSYLLFSTAFYMITNPYILLDFSSFISSMEYESGVALGTLPVFYTGEFFGSIPVIFQFFRVFPFLLNPVFTFFLPFSFFLTCISWYKNKNFKTLLLLFFFCITFFSQAFFFVKWVRYMVPTLPFVYLLIAQSIFTIRKYLSHIEITVCLFFISIISLLFASAYMVTAFVQQDTRVAAAHFASQHISSQTLILSEVYDLGIVPFNDSFPHISLFNFYDLEVNNSQGLQDALTQNEFLILPSQRLLKVRLLNAQKFPFGHSFYTDLFTNKTMYKKIYQTPCDIFCTITYMGNPVFSFEETANVFDRPNVFIYQK